MKLPTIYEDEEYKINNNYEYKLNNVRQRNILFVTSINYVNEYKIFTNICDLCIDKNNLIDNIYKSVNITM
jgi:hypothetical protein